MRTRTRSFAIANISQALATPDCVRRLSSKPTWPRHAEHYSMDVESTLSFVIAYLPTVPGFPGLSRKQQLLLLLLLLLL